MCVCVCVHTFWDWWILVLQSWGIPLPSVPMRADNLAVPASSPPDSHPNSTWRHRQKNTNLIEQDWCWEYHLQYSCLLIIFTALFKHCIPMGSAGCYITTYMSPRYWGRRSAWSASLVRLSKEKSLAVAALWKTSWTIVPFSICFEPPSKV